MADPTPTPSAAPEAAPSQASQDGGTTRVQFGGDPAADAAANAAAEGVQAETPAAEETPAGPPEGYESWEAYGKAMAAKDTKEAPAQEEAPSEVQAAVNELPEAMREKATPFFQEFADTGALTPESKKAAAEAFGVTEQMVDLYIEGATARAASALAEAYAPLHEAAGGKETYEAFEAWAVGGGMTAAQIEALNADMNSKDGPAKVAAAVDAWKASGNAPAPRDLTLGTGASEAQPAVQGFRSQAEMTRAMADPRYASDEAYRKDVELKVAHSTF